MMKPKAPKKDKTTPKEVNGGIRILKPPVILINGKSYVWQEITIKLNINYK